MRSPGGSRGVRQYNKSETPRVRWTEELHSHFRDAVTRLGGKHKATPKRILQLMGVNGLCLYHVKSHLQIYRGTGRNAFNSKLDTDLTASNSSVHSEDPRLSSNLSCGYSLQMLSFKELQQDWKLGIKECDANKGFLRREKQNDDKKRLQLNYCFRVPAEETLRREETAENSFNCKETISNDSGGDHCTAKRECLNLELTISPPGS